MRFTGAPASPSSKLATKRSFWPALMFSLSDPVQARRPPSGAQLGEPSGPGAVDTGIGSPPSAEITSTSELSLRSGSPICVWVRLDVNAIQRASGDHVTLP